MALTPLSASVTSSLRSIQRNQALEDRDLNRLATGRKVNSTEDDARAFVLAQGLTERAANYSEVGRSIGQSIGAVEAARAGIEAISQVVRQMKGLAASAQASSSAAEQASLEAQFNQLRGQIDSIASDTSYDGVSLISANPGSVSVQGGGANAALSIRGTASDAASIGIAASAGWAGNSTAIESSIASLDKATATLRGTASSLGINSTRLVVLAENTQAQANIATLGASRLTAGDSAESTASARAAAAYRKLGQAALRADIDSQTAVRALITRA